MCHQLFPEHGYLCPVETPEGPACGLISHAFVCFAKRKSCHQGVFIGCTGYPTPESSHFEALQGSGDVDHVARNNTQHPWNNDTSLFHVHSSLVLFNGEIIGFTENPMGTVQLMRDVVIPGESPYHAPSVYVSMCDQTVHIHTEDGRVVRPLLVVSKLGDGAAAPMKSDMVNAMVADGILRYVDAAEIATLDVALSQDVLQARSYKADLLEIHPYLMLEPGSGGVSLNGAWG